MQTVNIHEAKTHFSKLVDAASKGEVIIIAKAGKPTARLVPIEEPAKPARRFGALAGQFTMPEDFDRFAEDEIAEMFGVKE